MNPLQNGVTKMGASVGGSPIGLFAAVIGATVLFLLVVAIAAHFAHKRSGSKLSSRVFSTAKYLIVGLVVYFGVMVFVFNLN